MQAVMGIIVLIIPLFVAAGEFAGVKRSVLG